MMKGKDEGCWCRWHMKKAVCLIVIGVLVWLNEMYKWTNWAKFIAIVAVVLGIIILIKSALCKCKK